MTSKKQELDPGFAGKTSQRKCVRSDREQRRAA